MVALSAVANFIARYGAWGLACIGISSGLILFVFRPAISTENSLTKQIDQHALIILGICVTASLMALLLFISKLLPSSEDLLWKFKSWVSLQRCKRQFKSLSPLEKSIIALQLTDHSNGFFYPKYAKEVQSLTDIQWVSGDAYDDPKSCRYQFDLGVWIMLEKFRGEIRNQVLSDTYKDNLKEVAEKRDSAYRHRRLTR